MKKDELEFQELANVWAKNKFNRSLRLAKLYFKKGERLKTKVVKHNWKAEVKIVENIYYANKAIYHNVDKNLPFTTMALIGEMLSDKKYQKKIKTIIDQNVLSYENKIYKLNDLENQSRIRKALRTHQFDEIQKNAA
jgi:hypothetical protein